MHSPARSQYRLRDAIPTVAWIRDVGWRESLVAAREVVPYPLRTWRCRLFGHTWGQEQHDYEPNTGTRVQSWRECRREGCAGWWETYHYAAGGEQRVLG